MKRRRKQPETTRGCTWIESRQKWQVRVQLDKRSRFLGYYDSLAEARKVYTKAIALHYAEQAKEEAWKEVTEKTMK